MSNFYRDPFEEGKIYKLCDNGLLLIMNIYDREWINVSNKIDFDINWEPIDENTVNDVALNLYMAFSLQQLLEQNIENQEIIENNFGQYFKFFRKDNDIKALNEHGIEFYCYLNRMVPTEDNVLDETWETIEHKDVFQSINGEKDYFDIVDMDLYIDDNNDIQCFYNKSIQFRISLRTGEMSEVVHDKGILGSWKYISFSDAFNQAVSLSLDTKINVYQLKYLETLENYINNNREKCIKVNKSFGQDFIYYLDTHFCLYAVDEFQNEYICTTVGLAPVKKGTVNLKWNRQSRFLVFEILDYYYNHKKNIKNEKITFLDLDVHISDELEIYGISEDDKVYKMNKSTGELEKTNLKKSGIKSWPTMDKVDLIKLQAKKRKKSQQIGKINSPA